MVALVVTVFFFAGLGGHGHFYDIKVTFLVRLAGHYSFLIVWDTSCLAQLSSSCRMRVLY